jgi:hypothetical protein
LFSFSFVFVFKICQTQKMHLPHFTFLADQPTFWKVLNGTEQLPIGK